MTVLPRLRLLAFGLLLADATAQAPVTQSSVPVFGTANIVTSEWSRMDALVDANLDGVMDAVGFWTSRADRNKGELRLFTNDGEGRMSETVLFPDVPILTNQPTPDVVLGDWDGDGNQDFMLNHVAGKFSYFLSRKGGAAFVTTTHLATTETIDSVVAADFDGDGRDDVAVMTKTAFALFLNRNGLPSVLGHARAIGGTDLRRMDLDGDGAPDLVYTDANRQVKLLKVHHRSGWNGLRADAVTDHGSFPVPGTVGFHVTCGDYDNDGDEDVVVFRGDRRYQTVDQVSSGIFQASNWADGGPATALADIDLDGDLDGICCGGGGGGPYSGTRNDRLVVFEVAINDGGVFRPSLAIPNVGARRIAGAADMDGDGRIDLVAGRGILFHRAGLEEPTSWRAAAPNRAWLEPQQIADFDGEGDLDVLTPFYSEVYRNRGDGRLSIEAPKYPLAPGGNPFHSTFHYRGDWDGDGDLDLLLWTFGPAAGLHLVENRDGSTFVDAGPVVPAGDSFHAFGQYRSQPIPCGVFVVDLNADGLDDLVMHDGGSIPTRVLLNRGNRKFDEIPHGLHIGLKAVRDLDGDGYPELITYESVGRIVLYAGQASGQPGAQRLLLQIPGGFDFEICDHDGDGDHDVFAFGSKSLVLYENDGTGQFFSKVLLTGLQSTIRVDIADLDGDGRSDVVVTPASQVGTAWILTGTSSGRFALREQVVVDTKHFGFADMDGDGDVDVIGTSFLANVTFHGPAAGVTRQFGVARKGASGDLPQFGATGPFRTGETCALHLRHGVANGMGLVVVGTHHANLVDAPWPGVNTYVFPQQVQVAVPLDGFGRWSQQVKLPTGVANTYVAFQAYLLDPGAPVGIVSTNGVEVRFGN